LNTIATIDHNLSSGIARVSKELVTDIVVLNDSRKMNLLKRIVGDDRAHLMDVCDKTIFFCQLDRPSVTYDRILVICNRLSELEQAFPLWVERVLRLAKQLNIPIELYGTQATYERWLKVADSNRILVTTKCVEIEDVDDFFLLHASRSEDDLIVFVGARNGAVSHNSNLDGFPTKIEKGYSDNDVILIYPGQNSLENIYGSYDDLKLFKRSVRKSEISLKRINSPHPHLQHRTIQRKMQRKTPPSGFPVCLQVKRYLQQPA
jgi:hypothetical protein